MAMTGQWRTAWITGASTGIGRELALQLAASGVSVAASARSADTLKELANESANIHPFPVDVSRPDAMAATYKEIVGTIGQVDLAIFNAALWTPMFARDLDADRVKAAMEVNYGGVVNGLSCAIPEMRARRAGHIAIVASVAGYRGLPRSLAYGPTKAALINLAETLRIELERDGIVISLVNPGFVKTPMTAVNDFPMPFALEADDAAARIIRGLRKHSFEIAFPWRFVIILKMMRILPYRLYFWLMRRQFSGTDQNQEDNL